MAEIIGLLSKEAELKLKEQGLNELPSEKRQSILDIFVKVIKEPMLLLLLGSWLV